LDLYAREAADVLENMQAAQEIQRSCDQLRALSGRLLTLEDEERRRLARELHDTTAQWLAALSMNLSVLSESDGLLSPRARTALAESTDLADRCLREIRTVSYLLHPHELDELGLESALSRYIDGFIRRSGIQVEVEVPSDLGRVPQSVETAVFRIVQECLTNVHRHSGSSTGRVRLTRCPSSLILEVMDAGHGFGADIPPGVGIASMRERTQQLNGRLEIASHSNGTTVKATIPVSSSV
jgi:signal transduction histidine kinase